MALESSPLGPYSYHDGGVRQDQMKFVPPMEKISGLYGSEWENQFHETISNV